MKSSYPDISDILSAKTIRRRTLASLSWEEKVTIVEQMRQTITKDKWKDRENEKLELDNKLRRKIA